MLEAKLAGEPIAEPEPVAEAPVIDLMEALKKSVAEAKERKAPAEESGGVGLARESCREEVVARGRSRTSFHAPAGADESS